MFQRLHIHPTHSLQGPSVPNLGSVEPAWARNVPRHSQRNSGGAPRLLGGSVMWTRLPPALRALTGFSGETPLVKSLRVTGTVALTPRICKHAHVLTPLQR